MLLPVIFCCLFQNTFNKGRFQRNGPLSGLLLLRGEGERGFRRVCPKTTMFFYQNIKPRFCGWVGDWATRISAKSFEALFGPNDKVLLLFNLFQRIFVLILRLVNEPFH